MAKKTVKAGVAIYGCGTVGGATATILTRDREILRERFSPTLELRYIVDADFAHARQLKLDEKLFCSDTARPLTDDDVRVVVELIGGLTDAKDVIDRALRAGKHVVTANKALIAHHGSELLRLARENNVCIAFEASCAGGIPIIRALCEGLIANRIDAMYGTVNGTCNCILTGMTDFGQDYAEALAEAQSAGLAEADPTLDVNGTDSAHKLAILAALAFGGKIDLEAIPVEGIDSLDVRDLEYGLELGYVMKLLAIAQRQAGGVSLRVRPAFITKEHPLAWVSGPFNAISVYGHATGHTMYYGRGAGDMPTASAVVADVASVVIGTTPLLFENLSLWPDSTEPARQLPKEEIRSRYYIRVMAEDQPGVFAKIAAVLGNHGISIGSLLQHEPKESELPPAGVPIIITTRRGREGDLREALAEIDALDVVRDKTVCIGIVDEHPERLQELAKMD